MKKPKNLIIVAAALLCLAATAWFATSSHAEQNIYEIDPSPMVPAGYTPAVDTSRLMDMISQLIAQNQQLSQNQSTGLNATLQTMIQKLDSIDKNIASLTQRIETIEKTLKIKQPQAPADNAPAAPVLENPDKKIPAAQSLPAD